MVRVNGRELMVDLMANPGTTYPVNPASHLSLAPAPAPVLPRTYQRSVSTASLGQVGLSRASTGKKVGPSCAHQAPSSPVNPARPLCLSPAAAPVMPCVCHSAWRPLHLWARLAPQGFWVLGGGLSVRCSFGPGGPFLHSHHW